MRGVAALAGVSLKTVSRVINDEPGVADATTRVVVPTELVIRGSGEVPPP
jgi:DNA-binding LacI/PurR family transcriptional regulator